MGNVDSRKHFKKHAKRRIKNYNIKKCMLRQQATVGIIQIMWTQRKTLKHDNEAAKIRNEDGLKHKEPKQHNFPIILTSYSLFSRWIWNQCHCRIHYYCHTVNYNRRIPIRSPALMLGTIRLDFQLNNLWTTQ